jgi:hypothetical protein
VRLRIKFTRKGLWGRVAPHSSTIPPREVRSHEKKPQRQPGFPFLFSVFRALSIFPRRGSCVPLCRSCRLPFPCVLLGMVFGRFLGMVRRMESMPSGHFRVVRGLLVAAGFMVLRRFPMVFRRGFVMFSCRLMVFCAFVGRHLRFSLVPDFRSRTCYSQSHTPSAHIAGG